MMEILKKLKERLFGKKITENENVTEPVFREWVNCRCSSEPCANVVFDGLGEPEPEIVSVHYELVEIDCDDRIIEVIKYVDGTVGRKVIYADNDEERNLNRVVNLLNLKD